MNPKEKADMSYTVGVVFNGGWSKGIYYTWYDGMIWSTRYTIKQNKWKAKRRRKENIEKGKSGEFLLCPDCDGYGFVRKEFSIHALCRNCNGYGLVDWISRIRR